jgi:hypothetical protein
LNFRFWILVHFRPQSKIDHPRSRIGVRPTALAQVEQQHHRQDDREDKHDQADDFHPAVGPFALYVAGLAVDENAVGLVLVAIAGQPQRQQDVSVSHADMLRLDAVEPLVVAPNGTAAELADFPVHDSFRRLEAIFGPNCVALGLEPAQILGPKRFETFQVFGLEAVRIVIGHPLGRAHHHVLKEVAHLTRDEIPLDPGHLARLGFLLTLGVDLGVSLRRDVIDAALAGVVSVGHRVERPERHVDPVQLAQFGKLFQGIGGEPAALDPVAELVDGLPVRDGECDQAFRLDHRLGGLGLVFQVTATVGTGVGDDLVLQQHHGVTSRAFDFRGPAFEHARPAAAVP